MDSNSLTNHCLRCPRDRHCCYRADTIIVLEAEAATIIEVTGRSDLLRRESAGCYTIIKSSAQACPFLTSDRLCGIYEIRPLDCRSYPVTIIPDGNSTKYVIDDGCPPAEGLQLSPEFLRAAVMRLQQMPDGARQTFAGLVLRDNYDLQPFPDHLVDDDND